MYDTESIRRDHAIANVAVASGLELRPTGGRLTGRCPFHGDGRPSLVVYPATRSYYCFGCGAGGDVIDFVSRLHGTGFKEAVNLLSDRGVLLNRGDPVTSVRPRTPRMGVSTEEVAIVEAAVAFYHEALRSEPGAQEYLRSRGIGDQTIRRCRLGFGGPGLACRLRQEGLDLGVARALGLLRGPRECFAGRIIVPDLHGRQATWLTGRVLDGREPRYLNLRKEKPLLGNENVAGQAVIVTEGPFDWLTAIEWGLPAVALLGTHLSPTAAKELRRFDRVYVALDSDDTGRRATAEITRRLGARAIPVALPPGSADLNDLGRRPGGRAEFLACLHEAESQRSTSWTGHAAGSSQRAA